MKKLFVVLVVLGVLGVIAVVGLLYADIQVREFAEQEAEQRLAKRIPQADQVDVEIDAFPFVGEVLAFGTVSHIDFRAGALRSSGVEVRNVQLAVEGLELDRDLLLEEQKLKIVDIDRAKVTADIHPQAAARLLKVPVTIKDGAVHVTHQGHTVAANFAVKKRAVVLSVTGFPPLIVPLPPENFLPCEPTVEIKGDHFAIGCEVRALPSALMAVMGGV